MTFEATFDKHVGVFTDIYVTTKLSHLLIFDVFNRFELPRSIVFKVTVTRLKIHNSHILAIKVDPNYARIVSSRSKLKVIVQEHQFLVIACKSVLSTLHRQCNV